MLWTVCSQITLFAHATLNVPACFTIDLHHMRVPTNILWKSKHLIFLSLYLPVFHVHQLLHHLLHWELYSIVNYWYLLDFVTVKQELKFETLGLFRKYRTPCYNRKDTLLICFSARGLTSSPFVIDITLSEDSTCA